MFMMEPMTEFCLLFKAAIFLMRSFFLRSGISSLEVYDLIAMAMDYRLLVPNLMLILRKNPNNIYIL